MGKFFLIPPSVIAWLAREIESERINNNQAKKVILPKMFHEGYHPNQIIEKLELRQLGGNSEDLVIAVEKVLRENQQIVAEIQSGAERLVNNLMGMIMKELKGWGNPKIVREILEKKLRSEWL